MGPTIEWAQLRATVGAEVDFQALPVDIAAALARCDFLLEFCGDFKSRGRTVVESQADKKSARYHNHQQQQQEVRGRA